MIPLVTGQAVVFWILGPISIIAGCAMVFSRKPVHSALCLAGVMMCLAGLYASLDAPFLFVAQIIVYTGAVMMLFVFTMMMIGVDSVDEMVETIKGQRIFAVIAVVGLGALLILAVGRGILTGSAGLSQTGGAAGNVPALAFLVFGRYVFAFEATAALLVTAALAAMVLTHGEPLVRKERQRARLERRTKEFAEHGAHPGPLPNPGVFARHNSVDNPALLPDGSIAPGSVVETLSERGVEVLDQGRLVAPNLQADKAIRDVHDDEHGLLPSDQELGGEELAAGSAGAKEVTR
ncbi:NADH-quinone oxidoreductase subunit J [Propionibacterium sp.]|uniref:NADH-quinone oxidoreductase subunit J n=1 Tax=Propionibacterium sp. TaxID=1977903 RepID=UPI0039EC64B9